MKSVVWILNHIEEILGGALYVFIVSMVSIQVVLRYVVGRPIAWSDELVLTSFVWVVFLGASSAIRRSMHIGVDVVTNLLPRRAQEAMAILVNLLMLWLLYRFVTEGWVFAMLAYTTKVTPILRLPYTYVDLAVPVGSAFMIVRLAQSTIFRIAALRKAEGSVPANTSGAGVAPPASDPAAP